MDINIVTTSRRSYIYIYEMMDSLFKSDFSGNVTLIVGCNDDSYLDRYKNVPRISLIPWNEQHVDSRYDCKVNHHHALIHGEGPILICEDDIVFEPNWESTLSRIINQIPDIDYALNIGCDNPIKDSPSITKKNNLIGMQGIYYNAKKVRDAIALDMRKRGTVSGCSDLLAGKIIINQFKLWEANAKLISHIGRSSTFTYSK